MKKKKDKKRKLVIKKSTKWKASDRAFWFHKTTKHQLGIQRKIDLPFTNNKKIFKKKKNRKK